MAAPQDLGRVAAVLGPTNTGKTRYAIERMLAHADGMIGLPLRLLAREVYDKVVREKGAASAALITGEERIAPEGARYFICTAEAMPLDRRTSFMAVDEIQLCADPDRGHVFTNRLLHARGLHETLFLGADTMRGMIKRHVPQAEILYRERLSTLSYAGHRKLTKLAKRTAIVAFSAEEVYAIAELIRRQRGGAAVVMGALSPRTRNAQVELYQSGEVDFLVATDAIGMGLNMDVDHVAFASRQKFDGRRSRGLRPDEIAQIAGRAGRFRADGTFGETGECPALEEETVRRVQEHVFEPIVAVEWRHERLNFESVASLIASLEQPPQAPGLTRVRNAVDEETLKRVARETGIEDRARGAAAVRRLWGACLMPDFRKATLDEHARLVARIAQCLLSREGVLPEDWVRRELDSLDRVDGDLDALQARIAHARTWTYAANRADWLARPDVIRDRARAVEDKLSDALHQALTQRFIDRRTSALVRGLKREDALLAGVSSEGEVTVEGHFVGRLEGLQFHPDPEALGREGKAVRYAAERALAPEVNRRLWAYAKAPRFALGPKGEIACEGVPLARLAPGADPLNPKVALIGAQAGDPRGQEALRARIEVWLRHEVERHLQPLIRLKAAMSDPDASPALRGLAFRLWENAGALDRAAVAIEVAALGGQGRAALASLGFRLGRLSLYAPALVAPKAARLWCVLRASGRPPEFLPPHSGRTISRAEAPPLPWPAFAASGYRRAGGALMRFDRLERFVAALHHPTKDQDGPALARLAGVEEAALPDLFKALGFRFREGPGGAPARWRPGRKVAPRPPQSQAADPALRDTPFAALADLLAPASKKS
jgi:ATP-dependent RNA helicase SUPV3L1/SUV3